MRTQVVIVGAGPAGLMLAHLLRARGVDSLILENRDRAYVESRVRAGVLEHGTVDLLNELGLADRLLREGMVHRQIELGFDRQRHRIDLEALTGRWVTVYGQHEVVRDLIAAAELRDIPILFDCSEVTLERVDSSTPAVRYKREGIAHRLRCDYIAGCDGFHGVARPSIPAGALRTYERNLPYSWLGILADAPPSQERLVYMNSQHGFALFSMRSPKVTRLYLQCESNTKLDEWPDERIWEQLLERLHCADGWKPNQGPVLQKSVTPMRAFVTEPMQFGRLFLAGDAAHIVPPTGAKGMNLAIADVKVLADGISTAFDENSPRALDRYSQTCLRRVWHAQRFSWWLTSLLHKAPDESAFDRRRLVTELDNLVRSPVGLRSFAESYVGLPFGSLADR